MLANNLTVLTMINAPWSTCDQKFQAGIGKKSDLKDSVGNKQPIDTGLPSTVSDEGAVKTTPLPKRPHGDKDSEGLKPLADMEPLTNPVVDPSRTDAEYQDDQT
ncbi:hypothetical protein Tco_1163995 [Tanacetum coccineum]